LTSSAGLQVTPEDHPASTKGNVNQFRRQRVQWSAQVLPEPFGAKVFRARLFGELVLQSWRPDVSVVDPIS
jgi:hypothetical protein